MPKVESRYFQLNRGQFPKKVRPKDAKVTSQRVFTDDDVQHSTSNDNSAPKKIPTLAESLEEAGLLSAVRKVKLKGSMLTASSMISGFRKG